MPDEAGKQSSDAVPDTPLHAYGDSRETDVEPGSRGVTGDEGTGNPGSFQEGGHEGEVQSGENPAPAPDAADAPGADAGAGSGKMDPGRA